MIFTDDKMKFKQAEIVITRRENKKILVNKDSQQLSLVVLAYS